MRRHDTTGRVIGLITFFAGIIILVLVAVIAYNLFATTTGAEVAVGNADRPVAARLGESAVRILVQLGLLIVMTIAGSLIAGRGIQLFLGASDNEPAARPAREQGP